jgi:hypothetical protein
LLPGVVSLYLPVTTLAHADSDEVERRGPFKLGGLNLARDWLGHTLDWIRHAIVHNGRVLICGGGHNGWSPSAILLAWLIDTYALSPVQAFTYLHHRAPFCEPSSRACAAVVTWCSGSQSRAQRRFPLVRRPSSDVAYGYRCLCGACIYAVNVRPRAVPCKCQVGECSNWQCQCPSAPCALWLRRAANLYGLSLPHLAWSYGYLPWAVPEASRLEDAIRVDDGTSDQSFTAWRLFQCRICHMLLYATRSAPVVGLGAGSGGSSVGGATPVNASTPQRYTTGTAPLARFGASSSSSSALNSNVAGGSGLGALTPSASAGSLATPHSVTAHPSAFLGPPSLAIVTHFGALFADHHRGNDDDDEEEQAISGAGSSFSAAHAYDLRTRAFFSNLAL